MLEVGGDSDLAEEALRAENRRELRPEEFERHRPIVLEVPGEVDRRHASAAEFALDRVSPSKGGLEVGELLSHTTAREAVVDSIIRRRLPRSQGRARPAATDLQLLQDPNLDYRIQRSGLGACLEDTMSASGDLPCIGTPTVAMP